VIAETVTNPPATFPGPFLLILILTFFGLVGYRMWLVDQDRRDMELREQFRRDQEAQEQWEATKAAMARRACR
jgi:hypothetical protein